MNFKRNCNSGLLTNPTKNPPCFFLQVGFSKRLKPTQLLPWRFRVIRPDNQFSAMQKAFYVQEASKWTPDNRDPVVGSFDLHNAWQDYDFLFHDLSGPDKVALDFGCGPGRMIVQYWRSFKRIDGADIAAGNLLNAAKWIELNLGDVDLELYQTNGVDLNLIPDSVYDVVFSCICLQHIPVHEIRLNLFKEFWRVLKPGGWFTAQMGFGDTQGPDAGYYENRYEAGSTNGACDVMVPSVLLLESDLTACRFKNFSSVLRPAGPCDRHPQWVYFRAQRPEKS